MDACSIVTLPEPTLPSGRTEWPLIVTPTGRARLSGQFIPAIQQLDHTLDSPHGRRHAGLREGSYAAISANHGGAGVKKLVILNLVGLCVVIGLAYLLFENASSALRTMESLQSVVAAQNDAAEIRVDMIAMSDAMRGYLLDPSRQDEFDKKKAADAALVKAVEHLASSTSNPEYTTRVNRIGELDDQQLDPIEDHVLELAARDRVAATSSYFKDYLPVRVQQMALVDDLRQIASGDFDRQVSETTARMEFAVRLVETVGVALVLVMLGASAWAIRTARAVERQISGETAALSETASALWQSSQQVSRAAQSLSEGAVQQAASLEETSASMEEMASMVRRNAEHSRTAATLMATVDGHVGTSNALLDDMVASMSAIHEAGQQVSRIIKTIDEIAFQTNILALNAAVEAARAGEAGMGFAVVADEVRSLAQRSAEAARNTAELIERSMTRTTSGQEKVTAVAGAISGITTSVRTVKDLVDQVSSASVEQATGVDQVASALTQIDKVTQANAATAEQSAASSQELQAHADAALAVVRRLQVVVGSETTAQHSHASDDGVSRARPSAAKGRILALRRSLVPTASSEKDDEFDLPRTGTDM